MSKSAKREEQAQDPVSKDRKLRGILEYCLLHGSGYEKVPKTKLFKLIYLADFSSYYFAGNPISGQPYRNRDYGPVPDALFALVDGMEELGDLVIESGEKASFHRLAVEPKNIKYLDGEEKRLLSQICKFWRNKPTDEIVSFVHSQRPWSLTKKDEGVPYELILQENHPYRPTP